MAKPFFVFLSLIIVCAMAIPASAQRASVNYADAQSIDDLVELWKSDDSVETVVEPTSRKSDDTTTTTYRWSMKGFMEEHVVWGGGIILYYSAPQPGEPATGWKNFCPTQNTTKFKVRRWEAFPAPQGCYGFPQPGMEARLSCTTRVVSDANGEVLEWSTPSVVVKALGPVRDEEACEGSKG